MTTSERLRLADEWPTLAALEKKLWAEDAEFSAWRNSIPDKHWARTDLSALRLGYELGKQVAGVENEKLRSFAASAFAAHPNLDLDIEAMEKRG